MYTRFLLGLSLLFSSLSLKAQTLKTYWEPYSALQIGLGYQQSWSLDLSAAYLQAKLYQGGQNIQLFNFPQAIPGAEIEARQAFDFASKTYLSSLEIGGLYQNFKALKGLSLRLRLGAYSDFQGQNAMYLKPGIGYSLFGILSLHYGYAWTFLGPKIQAWVAHQVQFTYTHKFHYEAPQTFKLEIL